ncbi:MAG TPA: hypothetical protein VN965_06530, partial [Candidatus Dormibacteraeota bacterium]|nr:hypothetical protein [Candidatus Dormibacteraeota bacterium]
MSVRPIRFPVVALAAAAVALVAASVSAAAGSSSAIQVIDDSTLKAMSTTLGGASVLPTTRTVQHWFGTTTDTHNGVTYGYNMAGADPSRGASATIEADITPLIVNFRGRTYSGVNVLGATLASPQFASNDYGSTPAATAAGAFPSAPALIRGAGGVLSQGDAGKQLQLEDATMRAQFNQTGSSGYHLILHPNVLPAVTINVPDNQGVLLQSGRGVVFADIAI